MIGKPQWFSRRKYTGWGFTPKSWQGWAYILGIALPLILVSKFAPDSMLSTVFMVAWAVVFIFDFVDISMHIEKDERERLHEALAERNALWVIVAVLGAGLAYQSATAAAAHNISAVDPVIWIAIGAGLLAKIISNIYLDKKD